MINVVHPKVTGKPPIYRRNQTEGNKNAQSIRKMSTSYMTEESKRKEKSQQEESVIFTTMAVPEKVESDFIRVTKSMNDCNQNVIEPNSCPFEQLCFMINDLEKNSAVQKDAFQKEEKHEQIQSTLKNQVQAEKDYSQINCINNGSTYDEIMSFLGTLEVDFNAAVNSEIKADHAKVEKKAISHTYQQNCCSECNRENVLKKIATNALKDELTTAQLQLEEKEATIEILKSELKSERKSAIEKWELQKKEHSVNIQNQKNKYQNIIKRHQKFIEQIISEKKDMTEKCNALAQRIKEIEAKQQRELKVISERHQVELQRAKEICAASEKIRRERWLEAKTSKIKEMTVKGLEPELRNMVEQHQREIQDLRSIHSKELQDSELRTIRRTNQQLEQLRLELTESYDKMINEEKEMMKKRFQDRLDEQETIMLAQKRKFFNDLQEEKRKFAMQQEQNDAERDEAIEKACADYYAKYDSMSRKFEAEKKSLQESIAAEKDAWIANNQRQFNTKLAIAETRIRDECIRERDKQIELAIARLEKETHAKHTNLQNNYENKMRCLTEKYETNLQVVNDSERLLKDKLESVQNRLHVTENHLRTAESKIERFTVELKDCRKLIDKLTAERDSAKHIVRQEIELEKKELEEQIASLYKELSKSNFNKEALMGQIYSRIKLVMTQKDLTVKNLSKEVDNLTKKCDHLEQLLDQQRREYIINCL